MKQETAQYTEGPWSYEMAKEILRPFDSGIDTNHPESEANARLIAAAPLLLEALKRILDCTSEQSSEAFFMRFDASLDQARAAIEATQQ